MAASYALGIAREIVQRDGLDPKLIPALAAAAEQGYALAWGAKP